MSERSERIIEHSSVSFLATKGRALIGAPMSERSERIIEHGSVSFLATKWRALIGAGSSPRGVTSPTTRMVHR